MFFQILFNMYHVSHRVYILTTILFALLISTLIHGFVEKFYIDLLLNDFDTWSFGMTWNTLNKVHTIFTSLMLLAGVIVGYVLGKRWWRIVYIERKKGLFIHTE